VQEYNAPTQVNVYLYKILHSRMPVLNRRCFGPGSPIVEISTSLHERFPDRVSRHNLVNQD
jgi:hypothetical protein